MTTCAPILVDRRPTAPAAGTARPAPLVPPRSRTTIGAAGARRARRRRCRAASVASGRGWIAVAAVLVGLADRRDSCRPGPGGSPTASTPPSCGAVADVRTGLAHAPPPAASTAWPPGGRCSSSPLVLLVATVVFRRWRHLFTFLGSVLVLEVARRAPHRRLPAGPGPTTSRPSAAGRATRCRRRRAAIVSFTVDRHHLHARRCPDGRDDRQAARASPWSRSCRGSRSTSASTIPSTSLVGVALGVAIPLNAFRFFTPNEVVPGDVPQRQDRPPRRRRPARRGDPPGRRGPARRHRASTSSRSAWPARAARRRCACASPGDPDTYLFGKLYAMNHVRADRWYKLGRTILYGRLEDEAPFQSVRRLVQYEDYALRVMRDAGIPTAAPLGIVELTPGARVPARHRVLRRRASRSATPRSTTRSSTRASRSSAGCGTPGWPTATSSRPTCWSRTATSS